jgi:hypothetical protein
LNTGNIWVKEIKGEITIAKWHLIVGCPVVLLEVIAAV